jgi:hypothetical protein
MATERLRAITGGLAIAAAVWANVGALPQYRPERFNQLAGTYQLDRARSDDPERAASQAARDVAPDQRDRVYQNLLRRLSAPEMMAIDQSGRSVTVESTTGPRVTFDADGRERTETTPNGRTMTTRAYLDGDMLQVSTRGNSGRDYSVTFEPVGDGLRVTRRIDSDNLSVPVSVQSFYRRSSRNPEWSLYRGGDTRGAPPNDARYDARGIDVPDGTRVIATLQRDLGPTVSSEGERFALTIDTPGQYRGGVITGRVARANRRGSDADDMAFDFDAIRLPGAGEVRFEGEVESVRTPDGDTINVDRSGVVHSEESADTGDTIRNGAIGAAIGAIIGAVAGGGKGAAIGGVAGGVAGGAGTILIAGRNGQRLPAGTQFTIVSFSPYRGPGAR